MFLAILSAIAKQDFEQPLTVLEGFAAMSIHLKQQKE